MQQLRSRASSFTDGNLANFEVGIAVGLFLIALLPRAFGLGIFITSDEPLWMTRSLLSLEALLAGNPADTLQTGHPGVTTMWTGSVGLGLAYLRQMPTATFQEFLASLPARLRGTRDQSWRRSRMRTGSTSTSSRQTRGPTGPGLPMR